MLTYMRPLFLRSTGVLSPLLSNLYLTAVDRMLERAKEVTRRGSYTYLDQTGSVLYSGMIEQV